MLQLPHPYGLKITEGNRNRKFCSEGNLILSRSLCKFKSFDRRTPWLSKFHQNSTIFRNTPQPTHTFDHGRCPSGVFFPCGFLERVVHTDMLVVLPCWCCLRCRGPGIYVPKNVEKIEIFQPSNSRLDFSSAFNNFHHQQQQQQQQEA